jgi:neutral trehalase
MWMWDTAFHALGLQHLSQGLARDAIRALFTKQLPDGLIQLAAQPGGPVPERVGAQPPLLAWSICRQSERHMDIDYLNEMYPQLVRYLEWYEKNRKRDNGLYGWDIWTEDDPVRGARGSESGMDNSPRFDKIASMTAVDLSAYMASEYYSLEKIARCLDKDAEVAQWRERRIEVADRINELLWDDEDRFYYDLDEYGEFVAVKTPAGLMPLLGQVPDGDRAEALRMHLMTPNEFWMPFPMPSVARDEASYSKDTWRGPVWLNVNTLVYYGLMAYGFFQEARQLARISMQEVVRHYVRQGVFYEFYDAEAVADPSSLPRKGGVGEKGGVGFGVIEDFHWTAACFINFANEIG